MSSICATHLVNEDDTSFWRPVLTCFNSLVQEWDEGGQVQAMVGEWLGEMRKKWDTKWEVLIEAKLSLSTKLSLSYFCFNFHSLHTFHFLKKFYLAMCKRSGK